MKINELLKHFLKILLINKLAKQRVKHLKQLIFKQKLKYLKMFENWPILANLLCTYMFKNYQFFSLLPAKMCWELMSRVIRGPESMMMFQGRGRVAAG